MRALPCSPRYAAKTDRLAIYNDAMKAIRPLKLDSTIAPHGKTYYPADVSIEYLREFLLDCFENPKHKIFYTHWLPYYHINGIVDDDGPGGAGALDMTLLKQLMLANHEFYRMC